MKNKIWVENNKHLFKNLTPGTIYIVFENEKPIIRDDAIIIKKSLYPKKGSNIKKYTTVYLSDKGNKIITKIAICPECGEHKASKKLKKSECRNCLKNEKSQRLSNRYFRNKPKKKKESGIDISLYKGLKKGIVYSVFEGEEILEYEKIKDMIKPGHKVKSPYTKAPYFGKIAICSVCGKKRFSRIRLTGLCGKCQDKKNTKTCEEKKEKNIKTVRQIAFEITGLYQRVETKQYDIEDIFEVLWVEKLERLEGMVV